MRVRRVVLPLVLGLLFASIPSAFQIVHALKGGEPPRQLLVCHDGVWADYEYCGRDAYVATGGGSIGVPDMNHDCIVDAVDFGLFAVQYNTSGAGLSADLIGVGGISSPPDGLVSIADFSYFGTKFGHTASPCNQTQVPDICGGTLALSFNSNPASIDDNETQAPGVHTAYVVVNGVTNASMIEYGIQTSSNVVLLNHTGVTIVANSMCPAAGMRSMAVGKLAIASGPAVVATIMYQLLDSNPAWIKIAAATECSWTRLRWTDAAALLNYEFTDVYHAGINGATPTATSTCTGPTAVGSVSGNVYVDLDADCSFDVGTDFNVGGVAIEFTPGPFAAITDGAGNYQISLPPGQYTVSPTSGDYPQDCQSVNHVINVTANGTFAGNDFALKTTGTVTGQVYRDLDDDCLYDPGFDFPLVSRMIQANPGGYVAFTDANGNYSLTIPVGDYTISQYPVGGDPWDVQACQATSYNVTVLQDATVPDNDFALYLSGPPQCDVSLEIISTRAPASPCARQIRSPCPTFQQEYFIVVRSSPTSTIAVSNPTTLSIALDSEMAINGVSSDFPITVFNTGTTHRTVQLDAPLYPGHECVISVLATPSTSGPYDTSVEFDDNAQCTGVKTASHTESSDCSCDPNYKMVAPAGCGPNGNIVGDETMHYAVHFENLGPGAAHNVFIEDLLDADLELSSLYVVASSHTITGTQVEPGNRLVFSFEGIELPGTAGPGSNKGFVLFGIDPKPNLAEGTTIQNTAEIYFDFNEAVVTNTTLNTIRAVPSPEAAFTYQDACDGDLTSVDFTYSGGTPDNATFEWDFGAGAVPATSTAQNPANVQYPSGGSKNVTLTVTRHGCESVVVQPITIQQCAPICRDGVWEPGEYCGYDAYVTTGIPDMNHDCKVDGLDMGLFVAELGSVGPNLSGDLNGDNSVNLTDVSLIAAKYGMSITTGCTSTALPDQCEGAIAVSFDADPYNIVNNDAQAPGLNTAYIVVSGATGQIVEYSVAVSPNVVITSHDLVAGGVVAFSCNSPASTRVFRLTSPPTGDPEVIAEIQYVLLDTNPATLTITTGGSCSSRNRWATIAADRSYDFDLVTNAGINGPTPAPSPHTCIPTGITPPAPTPLAHTLGQNHPNPFNPTTTIEYGLAKGERVVLSVYTVNGARVRTLVDESLPAGWHSAVWDGRDDGGSPVASGVYLYRMQAGSFVETKKLVLLK